MSLGAYTSELCSLLDTKSIHLLSKFSLMLDHQSFPVHPFPPSINDWSPSSSLPCHISASSECERPQSLQQQQQRDATWQSLEYDWSKDALQDLPDLQSVDLSKDFISEFLTNLEEHSFPQTTVSPDEESPGVYRRENQAFLPPAAQRSLVCSSFSSSTSSDGLLFNYEQQADTVNETLIYASKNSNSTYFETETFSRSNELRMREKRIFDVLDATVISGPVKPPIIQFVECDIQASVPVLTEPALTEPMDTFGETESEGIVSVLLDDLQGPSKCPEMSAEVSPLEHCVLFQELRQLLDEGNGRTGGTKGDEGGRASSSGIHMCKSDSHNSADSCHSFSPPPAPTSPKAASLLSSSFSSSSPPALYGQCTNVTDSVFGKEDADYIQDCGCSGVRPADGPYFAAPSINSGGPSASDIFVCAERENWAYDADGRQLSSPSFASVQSGNYSLAPTGDIQLSKQFGDDFKWSVLQAAIDPGSSFRASEVQPSESADFATVYDSQALMPVSYFQSAVRAPPGPPPPSKKIHLPAIQRADGRSKPKDLTSRLASMIDSIGEKAKARDESNSLRAAILTAGKNVVTKSLDSSVESEACGIEGVQKTSKRLGSQSVILGDVLREIWTNKRNEASLTEAKSSQAILPARTAGGRASRQGLPALDGTVKPKRTGMENSSLAPPFSSSSPLAFSPIAPSFFSVPPSLPLPLGIDYGAFGGNLLSEERWRELMGGMACAPNGPSLSSSPSPDFGHPLPISHSPSLGSPPPPTPLSVPRSQLRENLFKLAEAMATADMNRVVALRKKVEREVDPTRGDGIQRVAFYFLQGLTAREEGVGFQEFSAPMPVGNKELGIAMCRALFCLPYVHAMNFMGDSVIMNVIREEREKRSNHSRGALVARSRSSFRPSGDITISGDSLSCGGSSGYVTPFSLPPSTVPYQPSCAAGWEGRDMENGPEGAGYYFLNLHFLVLGISHVSETWESLFETIVRAYGQHEPSVHDFNRPYYLDAPLLGPSFSDLSSACSRVRSSSNTDEIRGGIVQKRIRVRITAIDGPMCPGKLSLKISLEDAGIHLRDVAMRCGITDFEFCPLDANLADLKPAMVQRCDDEIFFVISKMKMHYIVDDKVYRSNPRNSILKVIRELRPTAFFLAEIDVSLNGQFFLQRVREAIHWYSLLFDSVDSSYPCHDETLVRHRKLFEECYKGRDIINVVACEGSQRVVRAENRKEWIRRMKSLGFVQRDIGAWYGSGDGDPSSGLVLQLKGFMSRGKFDRRFDVAGEDGGLQLTWKGYSMLAASVWTL